MFDRLKMAIDSIEPFFFGNTKRRLFGCCHYPPAGTTPQGNVVLCQAIGHEYIHSHRALFQLAVHLAHMGFTTLRFDYFGCGDSEGNFEEACLEAWVDDVVTAVEELQIRSGIAEVCLVGFRIGAALALKSAVRLKAVKTLVLWEIVNDGARYLNDVKRKQEYLDQALRIEAGPYNIGGSLPVELVGFQFPPQMIQELKTLMLTAANIPSYSKSLIVYNSQVAPLDFTQAEKTSNNSVYTVRCIEDPIIWENEIFRRLIPINTIQAISAWVNEVIS